jgi:hypothetical protein
VFELDKCERISYEHIQNICQQPVEWREENLSKACQFQSTCKLDSQQGKQSKHDQIRSEGDREGCWKSSENEENSSDEEGMYLLCCICLRPEESPGTKLDEMYAAKNKIFAEADEFQLEEVCSIFALFFLVSQCIGCGKPTKHQQAQTRPYHAIAQPLSA